MLHVWHTCTTCDVYQIYTSYLYLDACIYTYRYIYQIHVGQWFEHHLLLWPLWWMVKWLLIVKVISQLCQLTPGLSFTIFINVLNHNSLQIYNCMPLTIRKRKSWFHLKQVMPVWTIITSVRKVMSVVLLVGLYVCPSDYLKSSERKCMEEMCFGPRSNRLNLGMIRITIRITWIGDKVLF